LDLESVIVVSYHLTEAKQHKGRTSMRLRPAKRKSTQHDAVATEG